MNAKPGLVLEYTNCSQPWQFAGIAAPLHIGVPEKKFVFSCSEYVSGTCPPVPFTCPVSIVTPVTLSKDPTAVDMRPDTWAETSLPFPTTLGPGARPRAGG